jgi:hypothetical protein
MIMAQKTSVHFTHLIDGQLEPVRNRFVITQNSLDLNIAAFSETK